MPEAWAPSTSVLVGWLQRVHGGATTQLSYSDAKVANRDIKVWHFVIENGY
jgi:hypothetical protein